MNIVPFVPPSGCARLGLRAALRSSHPLPLLRATAGSRCFSAASSKCPSAAPARPHLRRPAPHGRDALALSPPPGLAARRALPPSIQSRSLFRFRPITDYNTLPKDYQDADGLPFRKSDLDQGEADRLFDARLSAASANQLLRIIHGRRVAGTLDDPSLQQNTARFLSKDKTSALKYLREHVPADEVLNAGLRAEDELKILEEGEPEEAAEADAQPEQPPPVTTTTTTTTTRPGKKSPRSQAKAPATKPAAEEEQGGDTAAPTGRLPARPGDDSPYGESSFDRIRARNIAKREAEEKRVEEERARYEEEMARQNAGPLATTETARKPPNAVAAWAQGYAERATSDLDAPPEMTAWQRLWPSLVLTAAVCAGAAAAATAYSPPRAADRLFPDVPPAAATVLALIGLNVAAFLAWKAPPCWAWCNRFLLVVPATPRALSLLGASFSHSDLSHLALNAVAIWFFGTRLHDEVGRANLVALYLACGAVGFMGSLANLVLRGAFHATTKGASGAALGLMVAYFWAHRYDEFRFFGYPPEPVMAPQGLAFIALLAGLHARFLFRASRDTDVAAHVWGMAAGAAGMHLVERRLDSRARLRAERMRALGMADHSAALPSLPPSATQGWVTVHRATVRER